MANAGEKLVAVELETLSDAELKLRQVYRQAQQREYPRCRVLLEIVEADLNAISLEAQKRNIVLS